MPCVERSGADGWKDAKAKAVNAKRARYDAAQRVWIDRLQSTVKYSKSFEIEF